MVRRCRDNKDFEPERLAEIVARIKAADPDAAQVLDQRPLVATLKD
jgi:hypothetical protein